MLQYFSNTGLSCIEEQYNINKEKLTRIERTEKITLYFDKNKYENIVSKQDLSVEWLELYKDFKSPKISMNILENPIWKIINFAYKCNGLTYIPNRSFQSTVYTRLCYIIYYLRSPKKIEIEFENLIKLICKQFSIDGSLAMNIIVLGKDNYNDLTNNIVLLEQHKQIGDVGLKANIPEILEKFTKGIYNYKPQRIPEIFYDKNDPILMTMMKTQGY